MKEGRRNRENEMSGGGGRVGWDGRRVEWLGQTLMHVCVCSGG